MIRNIITIIFLLVISCSEKNKTLPSSTGNFSEIIFVTEDVLWEKKLKEIVNNIFEKEIEGLTQIEPSYKIIQVNHEEFNGLLKTHKNIIIVSKNSTTSNHKNKWSKPQLVINLNWEENAKNITHQFDKIKRIFDFNERKNIRAKIARLSKSNAEKKVNRFFEINIKIPKKYTVIQNDSSLFWASFNPIKAEEIQHLLVFSFSIIDTNQINKVIFFKTDSVLQKHLLGEPKNSFVQIEPLYKPYLKDNIYRGLWRLKNGFMGGPFLLKTYYVKNKVIIALGIIYAPNKSKRNYIKELEAIL